MKRVKQGLKRAFHYLNAEREGITGLETSIILIAFVVVASVFAYTVLSAGLFSAQKGQEAIYEGLEHVRSTLEIEGMVVGVGTGNANVTSVIFTVHNALEGYAIDLTPPTDADANGLADTGSQNVTAIEYYSKTAHALDLAWTAQPRGRYDSDNLLESGEHFEITVDLTGIGEAVQAYETFTLSVKPSIGSVLLIERTIPARVDSIMVLH
jgi:flagellin FlaB